MPDTSKNLMQETLALVKGQDLLTIYNATGLSFYWLRKFQAGEIKDPSVNRVQRLYEYLSGKRLVD